MSDKPEPIERNRKLKSEDDVFSQNAWDDTEWTEEMFLEAERKLQEQREASSHPVIEDVELEVTNRWDEFYRAHGNKFFKDRRWIFSEFRELIPHLKQDSEHCNLFEVGCGVGNAVVHMIDSNQNSKFHIYCCDLSQNAIDTLKKRDFYINNHNRITPFCANICTDFEVVIRTHIPNSSLDFVTLIFTLSALKPELIKPCIKNLALLLKPGGMIFFRDYARYDLTQLRFKGKAYLRENYYLRADGTTSYFFTRDFVDEIFTSAGLIKVELKDDNRMLVNRLKALKMCRCWIQAKYIKPDKT